MTELLSKIRTIEDVNNFQTLREEDSKTLPHRFYEKYIKDEDESKKSGRPIYKTEVYIKILTDEINSIDRKATEQDKRRYNKSWEAFSDKEHLKQDGTLLTECNFIPMTEALSYRDLGIITVEQLIESENNPNIDHKLVKLAQDYIESSQIDGGLMYLLGLVKSQQKQIENLNKTIERLRNE